MKFLYKPAMLISLLQITFVGQLFSESKKYELSICAFLKNETTYLIEWIEYHRLVGVEHFYLYKTIITDKSANELQSYIEDGVVSLIHWPNHLINQHKENPSLWMLSTQIPAYENAAKVRAFTETKWLVFLDTNEFIVSPNTPTLSNILEQYNEYPGIILNCNFFDDYNKETSQRRKLLIETIELTNAPEQNLQMKVEKTIFKPDHCEGFIWPPFKYVFKDNQTAIVLNKYVLRINYYTNATTQEKNNYTGLHLDNKMISDSEINTLLDLGYQIRDPQQAILRFAPSLIELLSNKTERQLESADIR